MEIHFKHVSVRRAISFIFQIGNVIGVFHNYPFHLLGDTIACLVSRHFILIRMSDGFDRGRSCDTAVWAGQGWHTKRAWVCRKQSIVTLRVRKPHFCSKISGFYWVRYRVIIRLLYEKIAQVRVEVVFV